MLKTLSSLLIIGFFALPCFGKAWISSGGESFRTEKNPWFVKNTTVINYCIQVDQATVSASLAQIQQAVAFSFTYWKNELAMKAYPKGMTPIATQVIVAQAACDATTDIAFKVGYGSLDPQELNFLVDPTIYVGVAMRKTYDEVNLKAQGSIYISSDIGPQAYRNSGNLVTQAWSKPNLLQYALLHEVGHVMGIPHIGVGIMSETFLTNVLNNSGWTFFADQPILSFTQPLAVAQICMPDINDSFEPSIFSLDTTQKCMQLDRSLTDNTAWNVSSSTAQGGPFKDIGILKITNPSQSPLSQKPVIFVYLPDTQTVFTKTDLGYADYLVGAVTSASIYQGIFTPTGSHMPTHLQINLDSESIVVSGVVNNLILPVFNHTLPSLKGVLFP